MDGCFCIFLLVKIRHIVGVAKKIFETRKESKKNE